ncbi:MAG: hypothetical protein OEZ01_04155, partial [Candidatus Heimdallarchaeota archaeon]|nr:hypothetical protein [Candidatus Heimdallarchaeota archaeon]
PVDYRKYDDNTLYVSTAKNSYKIKRIKANPKATIAPCTMSGKLKGEIIDVTVRILNENEEEKGKEMVAPIYKKLINRIILLFKKGPRHYLEIT